jgi:hypothetical protein
MTSHSLLSLGLLVLLALSASVSWAQGADSGSIKAEFSQPSRDYSSGPLWVWNDLLSEEQIAATLADLAGQEVKQAFVHPRPGLMTPYLSEDWFRLWRVALREAERLDMNIWIYDENSYPSGFAGGFVPEAMPESRGRGLVFREKPRPGRVDEEALAVYRIEEGVYTNETEAMRAGQRLPEGNYLIAAIQRSNPSPWYGGHWYVDLLHPGVTDKFLEITMDAYHREIGDQFGKRVPGVFTDEPHLAPAGGLHWTDDLPEAFEARWGYSLLDHLPGLVHETGDWRRVRHNYFQLLLELFIERWAKPYYEYCERHGLEFTGHYWEHGWPGTGSAPDNMAMYAWHQRPAIDILFNQYSEGTQAQFGNVRAVIELASVANQLGRRTLCETYGGSGWDARFEDLKRIGDWIYVLGVNTLNEHLSHITIRGARKRDYPPSFSYHTPWWDSYHVLAQYFTRLSLVLSRGEQHNNVLLIEPTSTVWMYQAGAADHRNAIGDAFQDLVTRLAQGQAAFDIGCEDILARHGTVHEDRFVAGRREYGIVALPPMTENLNTATMDLLETYVENGGLLLMCGDAPLYVDGRESGRGAALAQQPTCLRVPPESLIDELKIRVKDGFAVEVAEGSGGILYHHRRRLDDGETLFLVNTSIEAPVSGQVFSAARGIEQWSAETGIISPYPYRDLEHGVSANFEVPPCGSLLLFLSNDPGENKAVVYAKKDTLPAKGEIAVRRLSPNVLTIDYVDVAAGGESKQNLHTHAANTFVFQKNGLSVNPWDHAVQFRDELISKTFPPESGFEATYRFSIEGAPPKPLHIVIERPDLYTIECNGHPVAAGEEWWLDRAFGKIDLSGVAQSGENTVTIKAAPFTMFHELESAYLLGNFSLRPVDSGFVVAPAGELRIGPWREQGHPLYSHEVSYARQFEIPAISGRYTVALPAWRGSVAQVVVNGALAGHIFHAPWECDVTDALKPGENSVEVIVVGTLKNTLGPHHGNPGLGFAGPRSFQNAPEPGPPPGEQYDTIGYGLFESFELYQSKPVI